MSTVDPRRKYYGSIPEIAQAYQQDPRTKLSQSMLATGSSSAPVAQGGWAVTDGLARAAQAIAGAFITKKNEKKYASREQEYTEALKAAAALAGPQAQTAPQAPNPAMVNPAQVNPNDAAQALAGTAPMQGGMGVPGNRPPPNAIEHFDPGPSAAFEPAPAAAALAGPQGVAPPMPQEAPQAPPQAALSAMPRPTPAPARYGAPSASQPPARAPMSARALYFGAVIPNEGGTNPDGSFRTSFKGAVGPGQIMPGTAPEAAKLAGLPYNEKLYRSDADYNNALGVAYLDKQLQDFGDPAKALAAYNAGPGAVRMAVRKARRTGGNWMDYLPVTRKDGKIVDTTKGYVERAMSKVSQGGTFNEDIEGVGMVQPPAPEYEDVPEAPAMPGAEDRPGMPAVQDAVQSRRIAMAQQMLNSGNPDLVVLAQSYLDKGLDEQNAAEVQRNQQVYGRENMGYQSELGDYADARSQGRQYGYDSSKEARQRNFTRETNYSQNTFQAGENAAEREQQARIKSADRTWQSEEARIDREWKAEEAEKERGAKAGEAGWKNPYFNTAAGLKLNETTSAENNKLDVAITKMDRALNLLDNQSTGGVYGLPLVGSAVGAFDKEVGQLKGIFNDATLQEIGGSLGVAISDGDRNFVADIGPNMATATQANRAKITALRQAIIRKRDFNTNRIYALSEGRMAIPDFERTWRQFAEANPLVKYDTKGNPIVTKNPVKFEEWYNSRPKYDAAGNRVK